MNDAALPALASTPLLTLARLLAQHSVWLFAAIVLLAVLRHRREWRWVLLAAVLGGLAALVAHPLADLIGIPRPFMAGVAPALIPHGARGSLPSAHASVMATIALAMLLRPALRPFSVALLVVALATGWARVQVNVHYPADIAAGFLLGAVLVAMAAAMVRWRQRRTASGGDDRHPAGTALAPPIEPSGSETRGLARGPSRPDR